MAALRGDISFRYLKQFFLVKLIRFYSRARNPGFYNCLIYFEIKHVINKYIPIKGIKINNP